MMTQVLHCPYCQGTEVEGWRAQAHKALTATDYRAGVDKFLEVSVDARVYLLNRWPRDQEDEEHDRHEL
jgi:hypothetical protein